VRCALALFLPLAAAGADWSQWGGPERNFHLPPQEIKAWGAEGPKKLWSRALGDGYSAIVVAGGVLYTMYRTDPKVDVVAALNAKTGETVWEFKYDAPFTSAYELAEGPGPRATPLVVGERVFTAGPTGIIHAIDRKSGKSIWGRDLVSEYKANIKPRGYASSPLAYGDMIIVQCGGPGAGLVAFRQSDGKEVWRSSDFKNSYASPVLIRVDGHEQVIAFLYGEVAGFDPKSGRLLWSHPHVTFSGVNCVTPLWDEARGILVLSSAYDGGTRALRLSMQDGAAKAQELWFNRLLRVQFSNLARIGSRVYGSSGDPGFKMFGTLEIATGEVVSRSREIALSSILVLGDKQLLLLDEDGMLMLAEPSEKGVAVKARVQVLDNVAWTPPSLDGSRLYLRDRKNLVALDLAP